MKKGYQARPEVRRMAEELLQKEYKPARVRTSILRVFGESVSTATIKRWRSELGNRSPEPFSLGDLGLAMQLKEQDVSGFYAIGIQGLTDLMTKYPGLDPEDYMKAVGIYFLGKTCHWTDVVELAEELCQRKLATKNTLTGNSSSTER